MLHMMISQRLYSEYFDVFKKEVQRGCGIMTYGGKKLIPEFVDTSEDDTVVIFACEHDDPSKRYEFTFTRGQLNFC